MSVFIVYNEQRLVRGVFSTLEIAQQSCCHTFNDNNLQFVRTQQLVNIWEAVGKGLFIQEFHVSDEWYFL